MRMRIISGQYGGRVIDAPDRSSTHGMSERIRNSMFNSIGSEIGGKVVLDAFAGSGSVGLEALSRGAGSVTFIEKDRIASKIISKNIRDLSVGEVSKNVCAGVASWLSTYSGDDFDVIFADPPYHDLQLSTVSKLFNVLKPNGLMVLSHTGRGEVPNLKNDIVVVDNRSYGNASLTYFRRKPEVD